MNENREKKALDKSRERKANRSNRTAGSYLDDMLCFFISPPHFGSSSGPELVVLKSFWLLICSSAQRALKRSRKAIFFGCRA